MGTSLARARTRREAIDVATIMSAPEQSTTASASAAPENSSPPATADSLRAAIVSRGEEVRRCRAVGGEAELAQAATALEALLALKAQYLALTGEEYQKKGGGGKRKVATEAEAAASAAARRPKQPRIIMKPQKKDAGPSERLSSDSVSTVHAHVLC